MTKAKRRGLLSGPADGVAALLRGGAPFGLVTLAVEMFVDHVSEGGRAFGVVLGQRPVGRDAELLFDLRTASVVLGKIEEPPFKSAAASSNGG